VLEADSCEGAVCDVPVGLVHAVAFEGEKLPVEVGTHGLALREGAHLVLADAGPARPLQSPTRWASGRTAWRARVYAVHGADVGGAALLAPRRSAAARARCPTVMLTPIMTVITA